jgi:hypothetical protein
VAKRVRAGNEVIVIDSDEESDDALPVNGSTGGQINEIDWHKVAELFRVKGSSLA